MGPRLLSYNLKGHILPRANDISIFFGDCRIGHRHNYTYTFLITFGPTLICSLHAVSWRI